MKTRANELFKLASIEVIHIGFLSQYFSRLSFHLYFLLNMLHKVLYY